MRFHAFDRRAKTAPSSYPRVVFHGIRSAQLLASLVVGGIMMYFIYQLTHDKWNTPWTFIWLSAASLFSIVALLVTIVLHCCFGLNPRFNLAINGFLLVVWAISWSLLTWFMSGTLANMCDVQHWHEDVGIMVCRIYKALFTFTLLGFISTIAAFLLDIWVHRKNTSRGMYTLQELDHKNRPNAVRGPFTDLDHDENRPGSPRESSAWEAPRNSMGPYGEQPELRAPRHGYAVPEGQFGYDTGYSNGHHQMR
ncbi:hypothetical protein CBER1_00799 [Cercospora berteroae]|uniref:MARVEL domain-containing protein n=1 Tax=Cercospora berteroae TaxID=357750 RepID=A0A2S6C1P9_9PEZI|nr:hypothetical protein CBER1_00799 [Cercospora berteroae]